MPPPWCESSSPTYPTYPVRYLAVASMDRIINIYLTGSNDLVRRFTGTRLVAGMSQKRRQKESKPQRKEGAKGEVQKSGLQAPLAPPNPLANPLRTPEYTSNPPTLLPWHPVAKHLRPLHAACRRRTSWGAVGGGFAA